MYVLIREAVFGNLISSKASFDNTRTLEENIQTRTEKWSLTINAIVCLKMNHECSEHSLFELKSWDRAWGNNKKLNHLQKKNTHKKKRSNDLL